MGIDKEHQRSIQKIKGMFYLQLEVREEFNTSSG